MQIKICDRCGRPIRGASVPGKLKYGDVQQEPTVKDLCSTCLSSLDTWYREPRTRLDCPPEEEVVGCVST